MADGDTTFTVKEYLAQIVHKQDRLDEKLDRVAEGLDRKADLRDLRELADRVTVQEQQAAARIDIYAQLHRQVDANTTKMEDKADKADVSALWRVLVGALSGSSIAILAWALTVFVR